MTRPFFAYLIASVVLTAACSKPSQVAPGVEAKPTKIERATSITMGSARATARGDNQLARIFFDLTAAQTVKELKITSDEQQLIDTDGKTYKSDADLTFHFGSGGGTMNMDAMFEVPANATLKTFKLGRASFDISSLAGAKPTGK